MKNYLTPNALNLLQQVQRGLIPPLTLTGSQIGTQSNFLPNSTMYNAQGTIIINNNNQPGSIKTTLVHTHETIYTVSIDQSLRFDQIGNILVFANGTPFLWFVSEINLSKENINPISHFAGDNFVFSCVLRYPFIRQLVTFSNSLNANLAAFGLISNLTVPAHTPSDQAIVEQNTLYYGGNKLFIPCRSENTWYVNPLTAPIGPGFYSIDGGSTVSGQ